MSRSKAGLHGYKLLLRTARSVFRDDKTTMYQARLKLKEEFFKNKDVNDEAELRELIKGITEVEETLKFNIVQGRLNSRGNYEVRFTEENHVTVGANQHHPNGADLSLVDPSFSGKPVTIERVKNGGKKKRDAESPIIL